MSVKKIAILYIGTGRYTIFWKEFYHSMEKFFLIGHDKTYFFFTDDKEISVGENVVKVFQENLGWPHNTLMRFDMFLKIEDQLKNFDYIYFLNGNMKALQPIGDEIFPTPKQEIMMTQHPGYYHSNRENFPYDNNPLSLAYIPPNQGKMYIMGGFNGGTASGFLKMCRSLSENVHKDLSQNIVALWHDESHLNKYILDKTPLILSPAYGIPEGLKKKWGLGDLPSLILIRDKSNPKYGGVDWLRGITTHKESFLKGYARKALGKIKSIAKILVKSCLSAIAGIFRGNKPIKVVPILGGLGNQMFLYALGKSLEHAQKVEVLFDISSYKNSHRPFQLDVFNLTIPLNSRSKFNTLLKNRIPSAILKLMGYYERKKYSLKKYSDPLQFSPTALTLEGSIQYEGYFQDERYFSNIRSEILQSFSLEVPLTPENQEMLQKILGCDSAVSLHIRRGDYLTPQALSFHGICSLEYYITAAEYIAKQIKTPHFFIFSDDIPWVKEHLKIPYPMIFVDINSDSTGYFDLELMKNCKHNIIANSSFSWWGAWLNENPQKIVIAPKEWFISNNLKDVSPIPDSWVKL